MSDFNLSEDIATWLALYDEEADEHAIQLMNHLQQAGWRFNHETRKGYGIEVRIEWHAPDAQYAAVFLREGAPWYLNGALVGFGNDPAGAVDDLVALAVHLVIEGENFLTQGPVDLVDREWLFVRLDVGPNAEDRDAMYEAIAQARAS